MRFEFVNSLGRPFSTSENITQIHYPISRFGKYEDTLTLSDPVAEQAAVKLVETVLSAPVTEAYFERVSDDVACGAQRWQDVKASLGVRGDILGDSRFLESIKHEGNTVTFGLGS